MLKIKITKTEQPKKKPDTSALGFGKYFTDHMFIMEHDGAGWRDPRIVPFGRFEIHPASTVLHYGAEIFEGLKAYRRPDGGVQMFRPLENVKRMNVSAERMCLPAISETDFMRILSDFVAFERDWVPAAPASLYLRPFMFGNDETLGVHSVKDTKFMLIASPVGSYYKEGLNPVRIMVEAEDVRAVRGGTGHTKCGGNYAASIRAGKRAEDLGFTQVLWLDGVERKYIEEVGAMNVMFKIGGEVITPMLTGSILPGITRKSILEMLRSKGVKVTERLVSFDEVVAALESGALEEAWGCGTAAVVSPIGELAYKDKKYAVNGGKIGKLTQELYDRLTAIQWGRAEDTFGWTLQVR